MGNVKGGETPPLLPMSWFLACVYVHTCTHHLPETVEAECFLISHCLYFFAGFLVCCGGRREPVCWLRTCECWVSQTCPFQGTRDSTGTVFWATATMSHCFPRGFGPTKPGTLPSDPQHAQGHQGCAFLENRPAEACPSCQQLDWQSEESDAGRSAPRASKSPVLSLSLPASL